MLTKTARKTEKPAKRKDGGSILADSLPLTFKYQRFGFQAVCLNRKLLTAAGVSICTERVSSLAVTAIATVCVHAALGARSPRETTLIHIWSQYEALFERQTDNLCSMMQASTHNG